MKVNYFPRLALQIAFWFFAMTAFWLVSPAFKLMNNAGTLCGFAVPEPLFSIAAQARKYRNESCRQFRQRLVHHLDMFDDKDVELFRHHSITRLSSFPFISGDTVRAFSDILFDETVSIDAFHTSALKLRRNNIAFLKTDYLSYFNRSMVLDNIRESFVLVTTNSDDPSPGLFKSLLDHPNLLAWYGQNADINHPKFYPLPIGLMNQYWDNGDLSMISNAMQNRKPFDKRSITLLMNFNPDTYPSLRVPLYDKFQHFPGVSVEIKNFKSYLKQLSDTKYVLSPRGNGLDCHRTWEAIAMGAVPIIQSSPMDHVFEKVPNIIIVESFDDVTADLLSSFKYQYDILPDVLYAKYWQQMMKRHLLM